MLDFINDELLDLTIVKSLLSAMYLSLGLISKAIKWAN